MEKPEFEVNSVIALQAGEKLDDIVAVQDRLNEQMSLQDYGSGLSEVFIVFSVIPDGSTAEDEAKYHPDDRFLELVLKLDKREVVHAGREDVRRHMEALLREAAIQLIPELGIQDFDAEKFAADMAKVFPE
jgi:hypothetical protein